MREPAGKRPPVLRTHLRCHSLAAMAVLSLWLGAAAADPVMHSVVFENDMMGHPSSDRNYTMGLAYIESRNGPPTVGPDVLYDGLTGLNRLLRVDSEGPGRYSQSFWTIGSTNFTPSDLTVSAPIPNDRPYASLLYLGVGYQNPQDGFTTETELQLGVLGTNIGHYVQTRIHRICCRDKIPQGWDNQIGQGGSPTFLYHTRWLKTFAESDTYRLIGSIGAEAGYYVRGMAGGVLAYGLTGADLDAVRLGGSATGLRPQAQGTMADLDRSPPIHSKGFAVWLEYEASLMAYNELLQGAWTGTNRLTYGPNEIDRFVQRASAGVDLAFLIKLIPSLANDEFHLYFTQAWRSRDIKAAPYGNHYWGGITVSWQL
jgi:hypothetical protein